MTAIYILKKTSFTQVRGGVATLDTGRQSGSLVGHASSLCQSGSPGGWPAGQLGRPTKTETILEELFSNVGHSVGLVESPKLLSISSWRLMLIPGVSGPIWEG